MLDTLQHVRTAMEPLLAESYPLRRVVDAQWSAALAKTASPSS
jgi:hypothetical protein